MMFRCGMVPVINELTRVTRYTATAIDHMFTNSIINTEIKSAIIKIFRPFGNLDIGIGIGIRI